MTVLGHGETQRMILLILGDEGALAPSDVGAWSPLREDQVQPALLRMYQRGWLQRHWRGSKRVYSLTERGEKLLAEVLAE